MKAFIGTLHCEVCEMGMVHIRNNDLDRVEVYCGTRSCKNKGIRYLPPQVKLEKAES